MFALIRRASACLRLRLLPLRTLPVTHGRLPFEPRSLRLPPTSHPTFVLPAPPSFPPLPLSLPSLPSPSSLFLSPQPLSNPNIITLFIAVEMPSDTNALKEAYSCVAGDVACNAGPAMPSAADSWTDPNNP